MTWNYSKDFCIFKSKNFKNVEIRNGILKLALFDLDGTLITPKNGYDPAVFHESSDPNNYVFLGKQEIMEGFQKTKEMGYIIAIVSNQSKFNENVRNRLVKIQKDFFESLGWSPYFLIPISKDYLKPHTKIIEEIPELNSIRSRNEHGKGLSLNKESFHCGDAVGKKDPYPPYQWSNVDFEFAKNLNIHFIRPIYLFEHYTPKPVKHQELIVMMGMPGSGKSQVSELFTNSSEMFEKDFNYINCETDLMPNYQRSLTLKCVDDNLQKGYSVIANANNPSKENRREFIEIAKKYDIPVRIFWFIRNGRPFNILRGKTIVKKVKGMFTHLKPVPKSAFDRYVSLFEEPKLSEYSGQISIETVY